MKMRFNNIGPIREADMELKDLTIIAGANNTGKTYLAYTLYGFLKLMQKPFFLRRNFRVEDLPFDFDKAANELLNSGNARFIIKDLDEMVKGFIKPLFSMSADEISDIFSAPPDDFKGAEFSVDPGEFAGEKREFGITIDKGEKTEFHIIASFEKDVLSFNLKPFDISIPLGVIRHLLIEAFLALCKDLPNPFILSAERFGISLFYKELDFTKNRIVEILQKLKDRDASGNIDPFFRLMDQTSSRYAQPIKDNIDYTRDLEFIQKERSSLFESKLFDNVKEMLGGSFKYKGGEIRFISKARKSDRYDIPLHLASTSARGLSDLYFFLKHKAQKGQLLVIDEPESHLDTDNQIEMARLLARCSNCGLKVLVTTHSDYIIKEFNNLIMLSRDFPGKEKILRKRSNCYGKDDFIHPDSIAAYVCEKGALTRCEIDHLGLNMPNFERTIDRINLISNELALSAEPEPE